MGAPYWLTAHFHHIPIQFYYQLTWVSFFEPIYSMMLYQEYVSMIHDLKKKYDHLDRSTVEGHNLFTPRKLWDKYHFHPNQQLHILSALFIAYNIYYEWAIYQTN